MQRFQTIPPVGVLYDCDLGNDIEDALALALLFGLDGKQECRVVATTVSKPNLKSAALAEVIGRFYAGQVSGAFMSRGRTLPVGMATEGPRPEDTPMLTEPLSRKTAEGTPTYQHGIEKLTDTADPITVLHNAVTAQNAENAVFLLSGPATNLAALLRYPVAPPFLKERVRLLVVALGNYAAAKSDPAVAHDLAAAKRLFAEWPTPVVAVGGEIGEAIPYPATSIETDFAWNPDHPVVDAYKAFKPMPYDASTTAMAAVLYAVRGDKSGFQLSDPGTVTILDDGSTKFTPSADGRHRHLILPAAEKDKILETYISIASAKPVPRPTRRRPPQVEEPKPKAPEPKPSEVKPSEAKPSTGAAK